jgi:hypothetical protein
MNIIKAVNWTLWIEVPGGAPVTLVSFETANSTAARALAAEYITLAGKSSPVDFANYTGYYTNLRVVFLLELLA